MAKIVAFLVSMMTLSVALAYAPEGKNSPVEPPKVEKGYNVPFGEIALTVSRYAFVYNLDERVLFDTLRCESNFNVNAINTKEVHGSSHGIAQFRQSTFDEWSKKAGIENGSPYDYDDAIKTMAYMISQGQGRHWTCFRKL